MVVLLLLVKPLGLYMAWVYEETPMWIDKLLGPIERLIYKLSGVRREEMTWKTYAVAMMLFNARRHSGRLPASTASTASAAQPHGDDAGLTRLFL